MRLWPRTIRWQMVCGLVLLEALSIGLFALLLVTRLSHDVHRRTQDRLVHQSTSLAIQSREALLAEQADAVGVAVRTAGDVPGVSQAKVTDPDGNILFQSRAASGSNKLQQTELAQIAQLKQDQLETFSVGRDRWESATPIYTGADLRGFAWIESDPAWDDAELRETEWATFVFGIIWITASLALVWFLSRSISRPLAVLHGGTMALMAAPESIDGFPLPVTVDNEFGDLIETFNRMVASIEEQRLGLHDTLSLLDSMLANAPIGLAFFDRHRRFVRVNHVFAELTGAPLSRHLGRTMPELLPEAIAKQIEEAVQQVFASEEAVHDLEISGKGGKPARVWTWTVSAYPILATSGLVRWAGVIVQDVSERKRSEEALRKTEKLAATGRLAASIAHEINNPLEAITNLLFLLRNFCALQEPALNYVLLAESECKRIAEIAQQTLRFYRQSTLPHRASMSELLDSVLSLYQTRLNTFNILVERKYDPQLDLFCFAGEIRQVIANLVGNALDATSSGGRLEVRARRSRNWKSPDCPGVRITVADTGTGMEPEVSERIFEAFFTTKDISGTGLGLWVSLEIILKHRGLVKVRSRVADGHKTSGTVFQLFIPDDETLTYVTPTLSA
jgi:PAS domain S-box-containing protein